MNRNILTLSLIVFLTGILSFSCVSDDEPAEDPVQIGSTIPDFSVKLTDGTTVSSGELRGSQSVIVFFYNKCTKQWVAPREIIPMAKHSFCAYRGKRIRRVSKTTGRATALQCLYRHRMTDEYSNFSPAGPFREYISCRPTSK